jgi:hypothetical protein
MHSVPVSFMTMCWIPWVGVTSVNAAKGTHYVAVDRVIHPTASYSNAAHNVVKQNPDRFRRISLIY